MQVPAEGLSIQAGAPVRNRRVADSGNVLDTWFCPTCGSSLYAQNSARPRVRTVHVGTLVRPEAEEVTAHIWVKRRLPWVVIPGSHRVFEGPGNWTADYARDPTRYRPA